jgi:hypothetical protein
MASPLPTGHRSPAIRPAAALRRRSRTTPFTVQLESGDEVEVQLSVDRDLGVCAIA